MKNVKGHFREKPLPSSGLLPFIRTYICEANDTCYDYAANNNYDQKFFDKIVDITLNASNIAQSLFNPTNLATLVKLSNVTSTVVQQRNLATSYTSELNHDHIIYETSMMNSFKF